MAERIKAFDWSSSLGPVAGWPPSLRTIVGFMVHSPTPLVLLWGEPGIMIYNDAYAVFAGARHPKLLGSKVREGWPEVAAFNDNVMKVGLAGGTLQYKDQELTLIRTGRPETAWMNLDYSPVYDESGKPAGVMAIVIETTERVLADRSKAAEQERQRRLFEQAPGFIIIMSGPDHVVEFVNDAHRRVFNSHDWVGKPIRQAFPSIEGQGFFQVLDSVYATGISRQFSDQAVRYRREAAATAETRYLTFTYAPTYNDDNKVSGIFCEGFDVSETRRAQQALAESEARFRALVMATSDALYRMSADWTEMRQLDGRGFLPDTDGPSIAWQDAYLLPEDRPAVTAAIDEAIRTKGVFQLEHRVRQADGRVGWAFSRAVPWLDAQGEIIEWFGTASDVTEAHQARDALRTSEDRLRLATEAAAIGTWDFNPVTGELRWDARCKTLFGLPPDAEVTYDGVFLAGLHPDDRDRTDRAVQAALAPGGSPHYDIEYRTIGLGDGVERWIAATGDALFRDGRAIRFVGTVRDISAQKRAEERFAILNRTGATVAGNLDIETIVQGMTDAGVELTGADFGAFFYNLVDERGESYRLYALSGVPRDAFEGFPMPRNTEIFAPTFGGTGIVRSDDILLDPRYGRNAPHRGMPTGHLPVRSYLAVPVISRSGAVHGGLLFGHSQPAMFTAAHESSLTGLAGHAATAIDNARLFQQLQTLNSTLEQRVTEEVAQRAKAEEQLRQSQKMEAIGQLTGGIAHDFNNMLGVVIGGLELIQRRIERGDTNVNRYIEGAKDGAQRAASLTQRLLAFSRQQPLQPVSVDANRLVVSMTDLLARTLGEQVRIETIQASNLWRIFADPVQLESAILNLAVNARDAMADGGKLTIETANASIDDVSAREYGVPAGQYLMIAVSDTGAGMSPDVMAQAFDPFFTTKSIGRGTGLGLSQVFGFVRQSGGHVKLYSEEGYGTTVKIYLPRFYGEDAGAASAAAPVRAETGLASEVILVVEDNERVRNYSIEALKELGYSVVAAPSGPEALKLLDSGVRANLLFTDVVMPDMNGRQLADQAVKRLPDLKVLFTTGYTRNAVVHNGVLDAGTAFLQKPFTIDKLAAKIRGVLDS